MAESAVSFLLEHLGPLLVDEAKLLKGVRGEAIKIRDELESMRAFLRDADAKEDTIESIKTWVRQVRHAAYDIEDILDDFILHIGQYHQEDSGGVFGSLWRMARSIKKLWCRHRIGRQIKDMRSHLSEISKRKDEYGLNTREQIWIPTNSDGEVYDPRLAALFTEESEIVGIDEQRAKLISWLLGSEQRLSTMAVVGMGGLGKTTLVKKVYDGVREHFQTCAWITVSQTFTKIKLLKDTITEFYQAKHEQAPCGLGEMTETRLIEVLRDYLQNNKFLLVFDDVWQIDDWKLLSDALPKSKHGSRVMLTTRSDDVASSCCIGPSDDIHKPQPLNPNMAWSLFCKTAFPKIQANLCPPELVQPAQLFVKKCQGLPLAIVTLGGLLASKDQTHVVWEIMYSTLAWELENDSLRSMKKILWLSFDDLPYYLKSCYLYLSVFPEDRLIRSSEIINLWMADGFLIRREGMTLEEVGESYLNALVVRNLVQVTELARVGGQIQFRVHDLLREIIISKSKEENLLVSSSEDEEKIVFPDRIRRLSIQNKGTIVPEFKSVTHVRSLFIFGWNEQSVASALPSFHGLDLLRIVCIENAPMECFPEHLTSLLHLRYLKLVNNMIIAVPSSIGKLLNLEALILENTNVYELPVEIKKLQRLRDLSVYKRLEETTTGLTKLYGTRMPSGVVSLRYLQRLTFVQAESRVIGKLGELAHLRTLGITDLRREDAHDLCTSVEKLSHLRRLVVTSITEKAEEIDLDFMSHPPPKLLQLLLDAHLTKLPRWITTLQNLVFLFLAGSRLEDDPLKALGSLPNLLQLRLIDAYEGEELCAEEGNYRKLKVLALYRLRMLRKVRVEKGAMPNLEVLAVGECEALVEEPCWLHHLTNLGRLYMQDMTTDFMNSLRSGAERAYFIRHIPHVFYRDIPMDSVEFKSYV